jgi:lactate dehydrogenase-like 2-hydroxyacid dehydrogenase
MHCFPTKVAGERKSFFGATKYRPWRLRVWFVIRHLFPRLLTFPNVVVTGHQAFFTRDALEKIASTTMGNVAEWASTGTCANAVKAS